MRRRDRDAQQVYSQALSGAMSEHDNSVQSAQRRAKLAQLRAEEDPYPNDFKRDALAADLQRRFGDREHAALEAAPIAVTIAGRMMTRRVMGKAAFAHLQDMSGRIRLYLRRELLGRLLRPSDMRRIWRATRAARGDELYPHAAALRKDRKHCYRPAT
ncbi:MAG: OB-fold nucleic acid binding domain-containing protein [Gammaproteobacteria bacterium]